MAVNKLKSFNKRFKIYKGYNFRVLEVPGFEKITFGCPPGIVKDFARRKEELTSKYILPTSTLVKGKNNFDFEFIVYSFLFIRRRKERITVYCTPDQKKRFKAILGETLFGPTFYQMLQAQFRKYIQKHQFSAPEKKRFCKFLQKLAEDQKLKKLHKNLLITSTPDSSLVKGVAAGIEKYFVRRPWLVGKGRPSPVKEFARNYLLCAQILDEMDLFAMTQDCSREEFLENLVNFKMFDEEGAVYIDDKRSSGRQLKVVQSKPSFFQVWDGDRVRAELEFVHLDSPPMPQSIDVFQKPYFGVTFLGVGSGFAHDRRNSCLVVWSEGKGIMVDAFYDNNEAVFAHGITENDIQLMFLSHVHSDHDSGFIEKVLSGQRIKIMTTRIIYESFLRKIEAITRFPVDVVESFTDFFELEPQKKQKLPGFERTYIEFDYSLHSIPAGRFRITCKDPAGKEKVISHSGDTKYDPEQIRQWYEKGVFSTKRYQDILGFIWDADLVIHEVGGGQLHTEFSSLAEIEAPLARKMVLVHQHKKPIKHPDFHFAREGETLVLIRPPRQKKMRPLELLSGISLFQNVAPAHLKKMLRYSDVVDFRSGETVFSKNDIGQSFYVVLDGFAKIVLDNNMIAIYEKGMFFGELAVATDNPLRRATVKALSPLTLLQIPKEFYKKSNLPVIMDDYYRLESHFNLAVRPGLVAALGFGSLTHWKKGESIFSKGKQNDVAYLIVSGKVQLKNPKGKKIAFLTSGDIMGEISIWKTIAGQAKVHAWSDEVFAVRLESDQVGQLMKLYPSFHGKVYQKLKRLESLLGSA